VKFNKLLLAIFASLLIIIIGCASDSDTGTEKDVDEAEVEQDTAEADDETDEEATASSDGKELRVAVNAQPANLDHPMDPAVVVRDMARLMFETLVTTDSDFQPVPMLAESIDVSDDGKTYTFHLREGIEFHNGKEMTSEDVVASMYRWLEKSSVTGAIFDDATWEADGDYTVVLELAQPSVMTLDTMASAKQAAAIMPKEVVEEASPEGVNDYIGTGPFEFVEWQQDQYIHFQKYDNYQPVDEPADGLAGKREALVDDIYFDIVTDPTTRLSGLQTGQYDIIYGIPYDDYEQVLNDPDNEPYVDSYGEFIFIYNKVEGPATEYKMREAINAALDMDEIMMAAFTSDDLFWLSPGYMHKNIANWASDEGEEHYNQADPEKAKEILDEIGYDGEEFVIMTNRDYDYMYSASVVIQDQLTNIGMNVELEVVDWATLLDRQNNSPDTWDAYVVGSSIVSTPSQLLAVSPTWAGGVEDDKTLDMIKEIEATESMDEAKELWDELQRYSWEEHLPISTLGGYYDLFGANNKVEGFTTFSGPIFWNTTINE